MKTNSSISSLVITTIVIFLAGCAENRYVEQPKGNLPFDTSSAPQKTKISYISDFASYARQGGISLEERNNSASNEFSKLLTASGCCQHASNSDNPDIKIRTQISHGQLSPGESIKQFFSSGLYYIFPTTVPVTLSYEAHVTDREGFVHYYHFSENFEWTAWLPMIFLASKPKAESSYNKAIENFHILLLSSLKRDSII